MREYEHRLKKHMYFQFNLIGFAFLCLCAVGAAGHFFKDAVWIQYRDIIDIFAYGFVDNLYQIVIKSIQSFVPFFLVSFLLKIISYPFSSWGE